MSFFQSSAATAPPARASETAKATKWKKRKRTSQLPGWVGGLGVKEFELKTVSKAADGERQDPPEIRAARNRPERLLLKIMANETPMLRRRKISALQCESHCAEKRNQEGIARFLLSPVNPASFNSMKPSLRPTRRTRFPLSLACTAVAILTGPIYAQTPAAPTTRTWDALNTAIGTFNWGDAVNWSGPDIVPTANDLAAFIAPNAALTIDLGGVQREALGVLLATGGGSANYLFQNGTLVTNFVNQNQDDPNAFTPTALVQSKNGGLDILNVAVTANSLQFQGQVTS